MGKHIEDLSTTKVMQDYSRMTRLAVPKPLSVNRSQNVAPLIDFSSPEVTPQPPSEDPLDFLLHREEESSDDSDEDFSSEEVQGSGWEARLRDPKELLFSENGQEFIRHPVTSTDTMIGLGLRYDVTVREILRENGMGGESELWTRQWIRIPFRGQDLPAPPSAAQQAKWKAERRQQQIRLFARKSGCENLAEAESYLRLHRFRMDSALQQFREDAQWEARHPFQSFSRTTKV